MPVTCGLCLAGRLLGVETLRLAQRTGLLKPSPTLGITGKAQAMRKAGRDVISFAAGEPDFNTPEPIREAGIEAIRQGFTKYTPSAGMPELREAIARKVGADRSMAFEARQVVASCGAKHSLYNAMMVLVDPGDEVILLAPYWMTYREQVLLAGGVPVVVRCLAADGFCPGIDAIASAITPRTKAIVVNSPSNPTGAVFSREVLAGIAALAARHGIWLVSDEIYEELVYDGAHASLGPVADPERLILIGGCSKTFSMTGWRIGYSICPAAVAQTMSDFQDQVTSNPSSISQKAAIAALAMESTEVDAMRSEFATRRDLMVSLFSEIPGLDVRRPNGAFYVFPSFEPWLAGRTDLELASELLEEAEVAAIPGSVFEGPGHIRFSYAANQGDIRRGAERIAEFLGRRR